MSRTAAQEMFGDSRTFVSAGVRKLPLPSGVPGAARFIVHEYGTGVDNQVDLPDARRCQTGGPLFVIANRANTSTAASGNMFIHDHRDTLLATLANGEVAQCFLLDNSTDAGTWVIRTIGTASYGSDLTITVDEFTLELGAGIPLQVNIRSLCDELGYAGVNPARVNVFVGPQEAQTYGVVGSFDTTIPALRTGTFPAGSIVVLTVLENGYIVGRGGAGGVGQPITGGTPASPTYGSATAAGAGGPGLWVECDTVLFNYGRIQGGGGGGGPGAGSGIYSGAGGGGGAGYWYSIPGAAGSIPVNQGFGRGGDGIRGQLNVGGPGGGISNGAPAGRGGDGGAPGTAGSNAPAGGASGGLAGAAIAVDTSFTLTKAVAGNIDGSETTL